MSGVLQLLVTRLFTTHFRRQSKCGIGIEDDFDFEEDQARLPGPNDAATTGSEWPSLLHSAQQRNRASRLGLHHANTGNRRNDITDWGSYIEFAPPVLPQNAIAPGDEVFIQRRREFRGKIHGRQDIDEGVPARGAEDEDISDNDDVDDDEEEQGIDFLEIENVGTMVGSFPESPIRGSNRWRSRVPGSSPQLHPRISWQEHDQFTATAFPLLRQAIRPFASIFPPSPRTALAQSQPSSSSLFGSTTRLATDRTLEPYTSGQHASFLRHASDLYLRWEHWVPTANASREGQSAFSPLARAISRVSRSKRSNRSGSTSNSSTSSTVSTMAPKTHTWISLWFLLSAPVIFWDASYCFMRPRSMRGGDLHWIWKPYSLYQDIDLVYGLRSFESGDGFTNAQSALNVIETLLNLYYIALQHASQSPVAPLVGLSSAVMTLSKTVLYWAQEYYCNFCSIGHNDWSTIFWLWIIPNGIWIIIPSLVIATLAKDVASALQFADKSKLANKKK